MEMDQAVTDGVLVVRPKQARIFANVAEVWKEQLKDLVRQGHRKVVIDLEGVVFADSTGLGAILAAFNFLRSTGDPTWGFAVANVDDNVMKNIDIMGIRSVIKFFPSTAEAVGSLREGGKRSTEGTP